ncbi:MAG: cupin domain-containing protein [Saprospiraceae bacterium]
MKKTSQIFSGLLLTGLFLLQCVALHAQDPMKAAPNVYKKVILENKKVRVIEIEFAPGETAEWHRHPNHVAYVLTDGKIEITDKGKPPVIADIKAGDAMYMPAVTHMAKNIGTTVIKMVVTELKPAAPQKMTPSPANKK